MLWNVRTFWSKYFQLGSKLGSHSTVFTDILMAFPPFCIGNWAARQSTQANTYSCSRTSFIISHFGSWSGNADSETCAEATFLRREGVTVKTGHLGELTVDLGEYGWFPDCLPSDGAETSESEQEDGTAWIMSWKLQSCSTSFASFRNTDFKLKSAKQTGVHWERVYQDIEVDEERYMFVVAAKMNRYVPVGVSRIE